MNSKLLISVLALTATFLSCKKHTPVPVEDDPVPSAVLNIISPATGAIYHYGDSIPIIAQGISTADIHGYNIEIRKPNTPTAVYYSEFFHDHINNVSINKKWKDTITSPMDLEMEIYLLLDHDGHQLIKKVSFSTQ